MSDGSTYAKRRGATRRLAQSTWRLVASLQYANRLADAIARFAVQPFASDGAGSVGAFLWGGTQ